MAGFGSSFAGNFIGGFQGDAAKQRERNIREGELQQKRDDEVFTSLANSEDPDIRAAAVTGLLTGNHPSGFLNKFFAKMQEHPAYEQIKSLVANNHQPFLSASEQGGRNTAANVKGGITGAVSGARESGVTDPNKIERIVMARSGAAQPGIRPKQHGTIYLQDGTSLIGSYDPNTGDYTDQDGNYVDGAVRFSPTGTVAGGASGTAGGAWQHMNGAQFRQNPAFAGIDSSHIKDNDYVSIRVGPNGQPMAGAAPVITQAPPSTMDHFSFFPTPTGFGSGVTSGPNAGKVNTTAPGGAGVVRAQSPEAEAGQYRADIAQILQQFPTPKQAPGSFFKVTPAQEAAWQAKVDAAAKARGYAGGWAELQKLAGDASRATGAAVPDQAPAAPAAPPAGPAGPAAPTAPQGAAAPTGAAVPPPAAPAAAPAKVYDPFVQKVLDELNR